MVEDVPLDWHFEFGLHGLELDNDLYDLSNELILRRIEYPLDESDSFSRFIIAEHLFRSFPKVVLELDLKNKIKSSLFSELFIWGRLFLLLGRGSVQTTNYYRALPKGDLEWHEAISSIPFHTVSASYLIKHSSIKDLKDMINLLLPKLRLMLGVDPIPEGGQPILIAMRRYHDAIVSHLDFDDTFYFGINCLEALFLKVGERYRQEKLVMSRISKLLSNFNNFQDLEIRSRIGEAYKARNITSHGGSIPQKDRKKLKAIHGSLQDYARLSIQIFLQLFGIIGKNDFIDLIDKAIEKQSADNKLKSTINTNSIRVLNLTGQA